MAALPRRHEFVDTSNQRVVVVVQMITYLKQAGPARTEVFGGNSIVVQGAIDEVSTHLWP